MQRIGILLILAALMAAPSIASAAGKHDSLSCTGCHSIHDSKGNLIFAVDPNKQSINPRTKQPYSGVTALCLGCHENTGGMGIIPVEGKKSHPYGISNPNTKIADVPQELLRDGVFHCIGCHDPHPSNANYKYLRVDTKAGSEMQEFCSLCHSAKSGIKVGASSIFSSMDQTKPHILAPVAPAPAAKPAEQKKKQ